MTVLRTHAVLMKTCHEVRDVYHNKRLLPHKAQSQRRKYPPSHHSVYLFTHSLQKTSIKKNKPTKTPMFIADHANYLEEHTHKKLEHNILRKQYR